MVINEVKWSIKSSLKYVDTHVNMVNITAK